MRKLLCRLSLMSLLLAPATAMLGCQPPIPQVEPKKEQKEPGTKVDVDIGGDKGLKIDVDVEKETENDPSTEQR